jgi:hypothetical protein
MERGTKAMTHDYNRHERLTELRLVAQIALLGEVTDRLAAVTVGLGPHGGITARAYVKGTVTDEDRDDFGVVTTEILAGVSWPFQETPEGGLYGIESEEVLSIDDHRPVMLDGWVFYRRDVVQKINGWEYRSEADTTSP